MLEGIDQVDWAYLSHAYGPAEDVPDQIRAVGAFGLPSWWDKLRDYASA